MRILKDYNQYVMRNLARGYSRKDLGVSYVKVRHFFVWHIMMERNCFRGFASSNIFSNSYYFHQEKQLQVNMKINKLRETVKAHQEKVTVLP